MLLCGAPDRGRGSGEAAEQEEEGGPVQGKQMISAFQQEKFRHFFYHVLDLNNDHVISQEDFEARSKTSARPKECVLEP